MRARQKPGSRRTTKMVVGAGVLAVVVCAMLTPAYGQRNLTDERIRGEVQSLIGRDVRFVDQNVQVYVRNGEVTLHGMVSSPALRFTAGQIALSVRGVSRIYNRLRVQPPEMQDAELAKAVRATLARSASLAGFGLNADVKDQIVVLSGTVPSPAYKRAAEYAVADVKGVQDIVNNITVVVPEKRSDEDILKDVLFVLGCDSHFPKKCPFIPKVSQGVVFLRGQVATAREQQRAVRLVELIKGVETVVDLIEVVPGTEVPPELQGPAASPAPPAAPAQPETKSE